MVLVVSEGGRGVSTRLARIDPPECGCTDCLIGYSKPMNQATREELLRLEAGGYINATYVDPDDPREEIATARDNAVIAYFRRRGATHYSTRKEFDR
jgi:hypothetical protein